MTYAHKYRYILFFPLLREAKSMTVFFHNNFTSTSKFNFFNARITTILNLDIILTPETKSQKSTMIQLSLLSVKPSIGDKSSS